MYLSSDNPLHSERILTQYVSPGVTPYNVTLVLFVSIEGSKLTLCVIKNWTCNASVAQEHASVALELGLLKIYIVYYVDIIAAA